MTKHLQIDVVQKYLAGRLGEETRRMVLAHVEHCGECRDFLVAASSLVTRDPSGLRAPPETLPLVPEEHYVIEREIARGGLGKILSARHVPLDRIVAVKELITSDPVHHRRFVREALVTAGLQHPAIVPVHEAGRWPSGEPFYAMKLVSGKSLQGVLEETRGLEARLALLPRLIAVGEALAYAHAQGIVHRDIKPANILLGDFGETLVIDWGLAKRLDGAAAAGGPPSLDGLSAEEQTAAGSVLGTPRYMSPEQARGAAVDARSDVYSLGVVLYELLAGASPYADGSRGLAGMAMAELEARIAGGRVAPIAERAPAAPRDLITITERALARDPEDRYPSAKALVDDLSRFATGQLVSARRYTSAELVRRWLRRNTRTVALAAAALLALASVGAVSAVRIGRARRQAQASLATLELDEARLAYLGGEPLVALAYLDAAIADGADGRVARYLVARASETLAPLEVTLAVHPEGAYAVAFSPDGREVVATGDEGAAAIWDASSGALLHPLAGHRGAVLAAAWAPDGRRLVTAGIDGVVRVWDPASGRLLAGLEGHRGYVPGISISGDGRRVVSWDLFGGMRMWDLVAGTLLFAVDAHGGRVAEVHFDPGGARVLSIGRDGVAKLWSAASGALICAGAPATAGLVSSGFSRDGARYVTGASDGRVQVFDGSSCQPRLTFRAGLGELTMVAFAPAGDRLLTTGIEGSRLWDARSGELLYTLDERDSLQLASFSPDGRLIASGGRGRHVHVYNAQDGRPLSLLAGHSGHLRAVTWAPDGRRLASASADGTARVWRIEATPVSQAPQGLRTLRVEADGRIVAVSFGDGDVLSFDAGGWKTLAAGVCPRLSTVASASNIACVVGEGVILRTRDGTAELIDESTFTRRWRDPQSRVLAGALGPGSFLIATATAGGDVRVSEAAAGAEVRSFHLKQRISALAFLDARHLITLGPAQIAMWDVGSGARVLELPGATLPRGITSIAIERRRRWLQVPPADGEMSIVDLRDGKTVSVLQAQRPHAHGGSFSPDASLVATSHLDSVIRVWDTESGALLDEIRNGVDGDAAFEAGGRHLLTVDGEGELQSWRVARDERTVDEIHAFIDACVPYRVERGKIVDRVPDMGRCH